VERVRWGWRIFGHGLATLLPHFGHLKVAATLGRPGV
jgi:hypothetical protein